MNRDDVRYGQRIRVNLPGVGDHGQLGTVRRIWGSFCSIHLDWDERPHHLVVLYARDLDLLRDESLYASDPPQTADPQPATERVGGVHA